MCRRSRSLLIAIAIALLAPDAAAQATAGWTLREQGASDVEGDADLVLQRYLERLGLKPLLAEVMRERLMRAPRDEKGDLAAELAELYAELLEESDDPDAQDRWRRLSRELLEIAPEADSIDLRLNLHRAAYARAEGQAERWRLRLADVEAREEAMRAFTELAPKFDTIGSQAHRRVEEMRRQEESAASYDPGLLEEYKASAQRQRSLAMYLAGWSNAYLAELGDREGRAPLAIKQFGWLLNAFPGDSPELDRVPKGSLQYEHVGRAAIGVGVCEAARGRIDDGLAWLELVSESENAAQSAIDEARARRISILAGASRWDRLLEVVREARGGVGAGEGVSRLLGPSEARLLAVLALDEGSRAEMAASQKSLLEIGLADLVAQGALSQVVDLVKQYGVGAVGARGFVARYLRGLIAYQEAKEAHRAIEQARREPPEDPDIASMYARAASMFRLSLQEEDAAKFEQVRTNSKMLLGLSLFYGSGASGKESAIDNLLEAAETLKEAAGEGMQSDERAGALIAAMRAADRVMALSEDASDSALNLKSELATTFLGEFPDHPFAGALRIERAERPGISREDAISTLLDVSSESPAYESARRRAARLLYTDYRAAPQGRRDWAALRYSEIAEPLLFLDLQRAQESDAAAAELAAVRGRRLLDALLGVSSPDVERVERILDNLDLLLSTRRELVPDAGALGIELDYRRAQTALARGDVARATAIVDGLRERASESPEAARFSEAGRRLLLSQTARRWRELRDSGAEGDDRIAAARETLRAGARLISDIGADAEGDRLVAILAIVSDAAHDLWKQTDDVDALRIGLSLHDRLLDKRAGSPRALRRMAEMAEAADRNERALDCWRTLSSGLPSRSDEWFEARYNLIRLLATMSPERARKAMRQHIALHPQLGPDKWRERFAAIARRLGVDLTGEAGR